MNRFVWMFALIEHDLMFAIGWTLPWFLVGLTLSPVVWLLTRRRRPGVWRWHDWANAGAVMMLAVMVFGVVLRSYMPAA